ncbi:MAG: DUF2851 family protein, partial [Dehalococcoidia bacterium]|nr:DUF2851 family protein [Dehalococcoidia bacterium]
TAVTVHGSGRAIPVLVLRSAPAVFPPPFTPPCVFATGGGLAPAPVLARMGMRRLRMKAAGVAPLVADQGAGQALYLLLLETLGGSTNRAAFGQLARQLPLAALLERAESTSSARALAFTAELKGVAGRLVVRRAGLRPMAAPGRRLEAAGVLLARLWPAGAPASWPAPLVPERPLKTLAVPGIGRAMALELVVNAVLPVAQTSGAWDGGAIEACFTALPSPGTYGKLRRLECWLGGKPARPFRGAAELQGALLLHGEYCTKGACGRCPMSGA